MILASAGQECRTKWEFVLNRILVDIDKERFAPGDRFYTVRELAGKYGVSIITAQRVFQELSARRMIVTNGRAGSIVVGESAAQTVYLCLRDEHFSDAMHLGRFRTIDGFLSGFRLGVDGAFADVKPISLNFLMRDFEVFRDQALLICGSAFLNVSAEGPVIDHGRVNAIREALNPIVFFGYRGLEGLTQVNGDHEAGMRQVVAHLAGRHERIGLLTGDPRSVWYRSRLQGYVDGMLDHGLRFQPEWIRITDVNDKAATFQALDALFDGPERPTALVCGNDQRALQVLEFAAKRGLSVPDNLAVTGFDNVPEAALCRPALTTLDGQDAVAGRRAAELLWKRSRGLLKAPVTLRIEPKLIVREST